MSKQVGFIRDNLATLMASAIIAVLVLGSVVFLLLRSNVDKNYAVIIHDPVNDAFGITDEFSLYENTKFEVETDLGKNVILIEDGSVSMLNANCPKKLCTHQHPISRPGEQIICLPHKLWIEIVEVGNTGSHMDNSAVIWETGDEQNDIDVVSQ